MNKYLTPLNIFLIILVGMIILGFLGIFKEGMGSAQVQAGVEEEGLLCPPEWEQVGEMGADIVGCGIDACVDRDGAMADNVSKCAEHCQNNPECKSFSYAPINGDKDNPGKRICSIYATDIPTSKWESANPGEYTQFMCKPVSTQPYVSPQPPIWDADWENDPNKPDFSVPYTWYYPPDGVGPEPIGAYFSASLKSSAEATKMQDTAVSAVVQTASDMQAATSAAQTAAAAADAQQILIIFLFPVAAAADVARKCFTR